MASTLLIVISMIVIGTATTTLQLIVGVSLYGLAQGTTSPTLLAWATDLSDERFKGRGLASLYISMELGIGLGAFISGWLYANDASHFLMVFFTSAALSAIAFLYLLLFKRKHSVAA
jgi:MFS family permease